jgi:hypothetical protein
MHPRLSLKLKPPPDDLSDQTHPTTAGKTIESLLHFLENPAPQSPSVLSGHSESSEHLRPEQLPPATSADIDQPPTTDARANLAKWLYYKENSPSIKLRMTTTPTPSPEDTMAAGHTPKNKSSNPDVLVAVEKQVKAAQQAAQGLTYTPFLFMPKKYRIAGVELAKITTAPPTVPKFPDVDVPMPVVGLVMDQPHSYSEGLDVFWRIAYTPAYLKYKTTSPFFELCDSTGKTKSADDCHLLPPFNEKVERLEMARNAFQDQLSQIGKAHTDYGVLMTKFRVAHRAWEVSILEEYQVKKSIMTDIRRWKREEDRKDDDREYDTFFFGDLKMPDDRLVYPSQWNKAGGPPLPTWIPQQMSDLRTAIQKVDKAIQDLVKPKPQTHSTTAAQGTKRFFFELSDDDEEDTEDIDMPSDLAKYRDWVADRHAAWDAAGLPTQGEDVLAKYNLPDEVPLDKKNWPASLKGLSITAMRITEDTTHYPWGKPALALQRTLKKAKGYDKNAMFTDLARKALRWVEDTYFSFTDDDRDAMSSRSVDDWKLSGKARKYVSQLLQDLD